jgi:hypothetical protein
VANRQDTDGDGLTDGIEIFVHHTNPALTDTDGDGLSDWGEIHLYGTNPLDADTDGDGMPDGWEIGHGLNPLLDDGGLDGDGDGLSNHQEYLFGTNPNQSDTDGDGVPDGEEVWAGLNPLDNPLLHRQTKWSFTYDPHNRLTAMSSTLTGVSLVYDDASNLSTISCVEEE